jgi:hypothetical protein
MLDPNLLGQKLADAATKSDPGNTQTLWLNIATEIINHIIQNGVVNVTVATTGSPAAQTGTGTGKIS